LLHDDSDFDHAVLSDDKMFADVFNSLAIAKSEIKQKLAQDMKIRDFIKFLTLEIMRNGLSEGMLAKLVSETGSFCGAFYHTEDIKSQMLELKHSVGFNKNIYGKAGEIKIGDGLIGAAASLREITVINNLPDDTIYMAPSVLGNFKPKSVVTMPILTKDHAVVGVFLLANIQNYSKEQLNFLNEVRDCLEIFVA
jgi:putative methionine-R-sulfoxide reductase with GAF domain